MSARNTQALCDSPGPRPYGRNWVWNGSGWAFVQCDTPGAVSVRAPFQSAFSGSLDGSADVGILPIYVPPPATPPNVLPPGGSIGEPLVDAKEDPACACKSEDSPRSIFWLVVIGMLLWLI
jgi:hypothetical protein